MTSDLQNMLHDHWRALAQSPPAVAPQRRISVAELPVEGSTGPLAVALDIEGTRHLLIPLASNESPTLGTETALRWRQRGLEDATGYRRYADLGCYRDDLADVFTGLCADILIAVEVSPERPLKTARAVVERWKSLFATGGAVLGAGQLAGLYGELRVLRRLLELHGEASKLWSGPARHRHDFTAPERSLEVKTSTATEGRRIRVHGLDQLEEPSGGRLDLVWLRVEHSPQGVSVPQVVDELLRLADDELDLLRRLADAGYRTADRDRYADTFFLVMEERWYEIGEGFPRLVPAMLSAGSPTPVTDVHYTVNLLPDPTTPLTDSIVDSHLSEMTRSLS